MGNDSENLAPGALEGIRVLDISTMLAGPYGATLLGDMGADVIKVESFYGDDSRHLGPHKNGVHAPFISLNRNKRAIVLDLQKDSAKEAFAKLLKTTDILITNVREPAMSTLGLAYEQVKEHKPDIIWIGVTAFGNDGPYAGRPGIDFLAQGYAGLLALNGDPDGDPVRVTVPCVDVMTSLQVSTGALAALRVREATGKGQRIDVCLLDALVHAQASGIGGYLVTGDVTPRMGNRSQYFSPSGIYPTKDGKSVVITCPSNKFFGNLCKALGRDWIDDPRFEDINARLANEDELDRVLGERCSDFTRDELVEMLIAADVLTAPVSEIPEIPKDPQILHNNMIVDIEHPQLGKTKITGVPIKMSESSCAVRRYPPLQGEHTELFLTELGYSKDEIQALLDEGAAATDVEIRKLAEERAKRRAARQQKNA